MHNILPPDHPVVTAALDALHMFSDELTRDQAALLLPMWQHAKQLSDREFRSVLAAFPLPADTPADSWLHLAGTEIPDGVEGNHVGTRLQICRHCGRDVPIVGGRFVGHDRPEGDHCRDSGRPVTP